MGEENIEKIRTDSLEFDPDNPRFYRLNQPSDEDVINEMVENEGVMDLMMSIGQKGYFQGEPVLVIEKGKKYTVVEGNRRLAAVKLLNGEIPFPPSKKRSLEVILSEIRVPAPNELPCLVYTDRKEIIRYLGYRHVTGVKDWDSLSKAKYLFQLREDFYPDLPKEEQMRALAKDIGSGNRSDYVAQLLTALALYNRAKDNKFYSVPMTEKDVKFSLITTALGYPKISEWLGLEDKKDFEIQHVEENNLKRLFAWMFARDQQGKTILGESRNLTDLAAIVSSPEAIQNLEETKKISEAYLFTEGPEEALEKVLLEISGKITTAWSLLLKTKLKPRHLDNVHEIFESIKRIRNHLRNELDDN